MPPVAVATDSTHYLPRALADAQGIHQVSLYVGWKGEPERELRDGRLRRLLRAAARAIPSCRRTSQPSIGDFLAVWEPLIEAGQDVVSIHLAGGISGHLRGRAPGARAARRARPRRARRGHRRRNRVRRDGPARARRERRRARRRRQGRRRRARARDAQGAADLVLPRHARVPRRGGRIGKAQAWLGGTLKIKPILSLEYEIMPVERVRTAGRAFERMVRYAQELHDSGADGWVVQHIQAPEQAQRLIDRCREIFDSEPVFTSEVGPVIGTYTGPGLIGVGRGFPAAAGLIPAGTTVRLRARPRSGATATAQHTRRRSSSPTTAAPIAISRRGGARRARASRSDARPRRAAAAPTPRAPCGWPRSSRGSRPASAAPSDCSTLGRAAGAAAVTERSASPPSAGGRRARRRSPDSRILRASSIAMFGTGGEPFLTALAAIRPASTPSTTRITAIAKKPQK